MAIIKLDDINKTNKPMDRPYSLAPMSIKNDKNIVTKIVSMIIFCLEELKYIAPATAIKTKWTRWVLLKPKWIQMVILTDNTVTHIMIVTNANYADKRWYNIMSLFWELLTLFTYRDVDYRRLSLHSLHISTIGEKILLFAKNAKLIICAVFYLNVMPNF